MWLCNTLRKTGSSFDWNSIGTLEFDLNQTLGYIIIYITDHSENCNPGQSQEPSI